MTVSDVAKLVGASWGLVKGIDKAYLDRRYRHIDMSSVKRVAIDEFSVSKGHRYMTVVYDLDGGRVIYVAEGKSKESLAGFWKTVKRRGLKLEAVATDMSTAYISSVLENKSEETLYIFDRFHIMRMMTTALSTIRREVYRETKDLSQRKVLKGTRWLLLRNNDKLVEGKAGKQKLEAALAINKPLSVAYYLKEELRMLWAQDNRQKAEEFLEQWVEKARDSAIKELRRVANTLIALRSGILDWYGCPISTGPLEGFNNKIKVLKRKAYGFRDMDYFKKKILALADHKYSFL